MTILHVTSAGKRNQFRVFSGPPLRSSGRARELKRQVVARGHLMKAFCQLPELRGELLLGADRTGNLDAGCGPMPCRPQRGRSPPITSQDSSPGAVLVLKKRPLWEDLRMLAVPPAAKGRCFAVGSNSRSCCLPLGGLITKSRSRRK